MTSAWEDPPDLNDRAVGQSSGSDVTLSQSDENQLEMFDPAAVSGADPDELRRLENSIRWLMNESNVRHHLPPAATLPPVRGLPPIGMEGAHRGAASRALDPDRLFPPRSSYRNGDVTRGALKFLIASAIAAPLAYFIAHSLQSSDTAPPPETATVRSFEARLAAVPPVQSPERAQIPDGKRAAPASDPIAVRAISPTEAKPAEAAVASVAEPKLGPTLGPTLGAMSAKTVAASNPRPNVLAPTVKPALSAQEIAVFVERGRTLFEAGDLAAARLFFRRAANAGDAAAALAMGATYDPDVLAKRFVRGMGADSEEARVWYEKARELGSPEGPRRLETLLAHR